MKYKFFLILIFLVGFYLRIMFLSGGGLTFSYDQGRDAFVINQILRGDFKIQGPSASTPGLFHGPFYYYLLAPAYLVGHGNPYYAAVWLAFVCSLAIPLVYYFSLKLFASPRTSLILALLFAVSYEQTQYAVWLSNPTPAVLTVPLLYFGLWAWINGKKWGPVLSGLALGLSVHSDIFFLYHLPVIFILWVRGRLKNIPPFLISLLIIVSTFIVSEIKFGFQGLRGLTNLFILQDAAVSNRGFVDGLQVYLDQFAKLVGYNLFPLNLGYAGVIGAILVISLIRSKFKYKDLLLLYVFSSAFASSFGGTSTPFLNAGLGAAVLLLFGHFISRQKSWLILGISFVFIAANLYSVFTHNPHGQTLFAIQADLNLKNELAAVDYIYTSQSGRPFSLNTITAPLYINTAWSYLFNWYGQTKYQYLPRWHGHDQVGLLGNNLIWPDKSVTDYYLIIDPPETNFSRYIAPGIAEEDGKSTLVKEVNFGQIRVQKRTKI